jgi:hypothetical protein
VTTSTSIEYSSKLKLSSIQKVISMLNQLYSSLKSLAVVSLFDNGWHGTISTVQFLTGTDALKVLTSTGTIKERFSRFNQFETEHGYKEENKESLLRGLLTPNSSGANAFCLVAEELVFYPNSFIELFNNLERSGCFTGPDAQTNKTLFLEGMFTPDSYGQSAFLIALNDYRYSSFQLVLDTFIKLDCYHNENNRILFYDAVLSEGQFLFRKAAKQLNTYIGLSDALKRAGCSTSQWHRLLNTDASGDRVSLRYELTPVIRFIIEGTKRNFLINPLASYPNFIALLKRFYMDGALFNPLQIEAIYRHLDQLLDEKKINPLCVEPLKKIVNLFAKSLDKRRNNETIFQMAELKLSTSIGSFNDRLSHFNKFVALYGKKDKYEQIFLDGLLTLDLSMQNIFHNAVKSPELFTEILKVLKNLNLFKGNLANKNSFAFLEAIFVNDTKGISPFLLVMKSNNATLIHSMFNMLIDIGIFKREKHRRFFCDAISADSHFIFNLSVHSLVGYLVLSKALKMAKCSVDDWDKLLNTDKHPVVIVGSCGWTPVMRLIRGYTQDVPLIDPCNNYSSFMLVLNKLYEDGSFLSPLQGEVIEQHLNQLFVTDKIHELHLKQLKNIISKLTIPLEMRKNSEPSPRGKFELRYTPLVHHLNNNVTLFKNERALSRESSSSLSLNNEEQDDSDCEELIRINKV